MSSLPGISSAVSQPASLVRRLTAEAFGTFCLLFAGTGAIVVDKVTGGGVSHVGIGLCFGLIVLAMIQSFGDVSGCHINPAVTIGFWAAGRFEGRLVPLYAAAQAAGAVAASLVLRGLFPTSVALGATIPSGPAMQSFWLEALLTLVLMVVVLGVSTGSRERGLLAGITIGGVIALEAIFAGPICGASMNPVRSLAPALVSSHMQHLWVYLVAPVIGAVGGVAVWRATHAPESAPNGPRSFSPDSARSDAAKKKVLFVCVENSNRSQMAEAFARLHGAGRIEAASAGSRPSGRVNPKAIEAMAELGYDLARHASKGLGAFDGRTFDAVVTMGCGDTCPLVLARRREDWQIPDPRDMPPDAFHEVRDLIARKVSALVASLADD